MDYKAKWSNDHYLNLNNAILHAFLVLDKTFSVNYILQQLLYVNTIGKLTTLFPVV